jgi:hypothetical protein
MRPQTAVSVFRNTINPLNAELNLMCHLLALLGAHSILHVSRIRVKPGTTCLPHNALYTVGFKTFQDKEICLCLLQIKIKLYGHNFL